MPVTRKRYEQIREIYGAPAESAPTDVEEAATPQPQGPQPDFVVRDPWTLSPRRVFYHGHSDTEEGAKFFEPTQIQSPDLHVKSFYDPQGVEQVYYTPGGNEPERIMPRRQFESIYDIESGSVTGGPNINMEQLAPLPPDERRKQISKAFFEHENFWKMERSLQEQLISQMYPDYASMEDAPREATYSSLRDKYAPRSVRHPILADAAKSYERTWQASAAGVEGQLVDGLLSIVKFIDEDIGVSDPNAGLDPIGVFEIAGQALGMKSGEMESRVRRIKDGLEDRSMLLAELRSRYTDQKIVDRATGEEVKLKPGEKLDPSKHEVRTRFTAPNVVSSLISSAAFVGMVQAVSKVPFMPRHAAFPLVAASLGRAESREAAVIEGAKASLLLPFFRFLYGNTHVGAALKGAAFGTAEAVAEGGLHRLEQTDAGRALKKEMGLARDAFHPLNMDSMLLGATTWALLTAPQKRPEWMQNANAVREHLAKSAAGQITLEQAKGVAQQQALPFFDQESAEAFNARNVFRNTVIERAEREGIDLRESWRRSLRESVPESWPQPYLDAVEMSMMWPAVERYARAHPELPADAGWANLGFDLGLHPGTTAAQRVEAYEAEVLRAELERPAASIPEMAEAKPLLKPGEKVAQLLERQDQVGEMARTAMRTGLVLRAPKNIPVIPALRQDGVIYTDKEVEYPEYSTHPTIGKKYGLTSIYSQRQGLGIGSARKKAEPGQVERGYVEKATGKFIDTSEAMRKYNFTDATQFILRVPDTFEEIYMMRHKREPWKNEPFIGEEVYEQKRFDYDHRRDASEPLLPAYGRELPTAQRNARLYLDRPDHEGAPTAVSLALEQSKPAPGKAPVTIGKARLWEMLEGSGPNRWRVKNTKHVIENGRLVLESPEGKKIVLGLSTLGDQVDMLESYLSPAEAKRAAAWYTATHDQFTSRFGLEAGKKFYDAWLMMQANTAPDAAYTKLLKILRKQLLGERDIMTRLGSVFVGGRNDALAAEFLGTGRIPTAGSGLSHKLWNFLDAGAGKKRSTYYGDSEAIGGPWPNDVWGSRAFGFIDPKSIGRLRRIFKNDPQTLRLLDALPNDLVRGVPETKNNDYAHRMGNSLTNKLNEMGWGGRSDWHSYEVQAMQWAAIRKALGQREMGADTIFRNSEFAIEQALKKKWSTYSTSPQERLADSVRAMIFTSPNVREESIPFAVAKRDLAEPRQDLMISALQAAHEWVHGRKRESPYNVIRDVLGHWGGSGEASAAVEVRHDVKPELLIEEAAISGLAARQKMVMVFNRTEGGPDRLWEIMLPVDMTSDRAIAVAGEHGFKDFTLETSKDGDSAHRLWLLDEGKAQGQAIAQVYEALGARAVFMEGKNEFVGDFGSRDAARGVFESILKRSPRRQQYERDFLAPAENGRRGAGNAVRRLAQDSEALINGLHETYQSVRDLPPGTVLGSFPELLNDVEILISDFQHNPLDKRGRLVNPHIMHMREIAETLKTQPLGRKLFAEDKEFAFLRDAMKDPSLWFHGTITPFKGKPKIGKRGSRTPAFDALLGAHFSGDPRLSAFFATATFGGPDIEHKMRGTADARVGAYRIYPKKSLFLPSFKDLDAAAITYVLGLGREGQKKILPGRFKKYEYIEELNQRLSTGMNSVFDLVPEVKAALAKGFRSYLRERGFDSIVYGIKRGNFGQTQESVNVIALDSKIVRQVKERQPLGGKYGYARGEPPRVVVGDLLSTRQGEVVGEISIPKRGVSPEAQAMIRFSRTANPTDLIHEMGHYLLEAMASPSERRRIYAAAGWTQDYANPPREAREKMARQFEVYFRDGVAPDPRLTPLYDLVSSYLRDAHLMGRDYQNQLGDHEPMAQREMMKLLLPDTISVAQAREMDIGTHYEAAHRLRKPSPGPMVEAARALQLELEPVARTKMATREDVLAKYADNRNLERLRGPEDWRALVISMANEAGKESAPRTETIPWSETEIRAKELGLTPEEVRLGMKQERGAWVWDTALMDAARTLAVKMDGDLTSLLRTLIPKSRAGELTDRDKASLLESMYDWRSFQDALSVQVSEHARALNILKRVKRVRLMGEKERQDLADVLKQFELSQQRVDPRYRWESLIDALSTLEGGQRAGMIRDVTQPRLTRAIEEIWTAHLLTGLGTHATNFAGNAAFASYRLPEVQVNGVLGEGARLASWLLRRPAEERAQLAAISDGIAQVYGMVLGGQAVTKAVTRVLAHDAFVNRLASKGLLGDVSPERLDAMRKLKLPDRLQGVEEILSEDKLKMDQTRSAFTAEAFGFGRGAARKSLRGTAVGSAVDVYGEAMRGMSFTALQAGDAPFKVMAYAQELSRQAFLKARSDVGNMSAYMMSPKFLERVSWWMDHPSKSMVEKAQTNARYMTFNADVGPVAKALQASRNVPIVGKMLAPFIRVGSNLLTAGIERTPLAPFVTPRRFWKNPVKDPGGTEALAKMGLGTALIAMTAHWAASGLITGGGPPDWNDNLVWQQTKQKYSAKVKNPVTGGTELVSYKDFMPLSMILGLGAEFAQTPEGITMLTELGEWLGITVDYMETMPYLPVGHDRDVDDLAVQITSGWANLISNQLVWTGMQRFADAFASGEPKKMQRFLHTWAKSFVPRYAQQFRYQGDPVRREVRGVVDALRDTVWRSSRNLPPQRDNWGEPRRTHGSLGPNLLSRAYQKPEVIDPVYREQERLGVSFPPTPWTVEGYKLGSWQRDAWARRAAAGAGTGKAGADGKIGSVIADIGAKRTMDLIVADQIPVVPSDFGAQRIVAEARSGRQPTSKKYDRALKWSEMNDYEQANVMHGVLSAARRYAWAGYYEGGRRGGNLMIPGLLQGLPPEEQTKIQRREMLSPLGEGRR